MRADKQTDRHTDMTERPPHAGMGNKENAKTEVIPVKFNHLLTKQQLVYYELLHAAET